MGGGVTDAYATEKKVRPTKGRQPKFFFVFSPIFCFPPADVVKNTRVKLRLTPHLKDNVCRFFQVDFACCTGMNSTQ